MAHNHIVADTISLDTAFALSSPSKVIRGMAQDKHNTYAIREDIVKAVGRQSKEWQDEFWNQAYRRGLELE